MKEEFSQPVVGGSISRKVVVSRTDKIGDVILSLPVFATLKRCFPQTETFALVRNYTSDVVLSSPYVDQVVPCEPDESIFSIYRKLRKVDAEIMLALFPRFKVAAASFLARIPIRVGTAYRWYSFLFNKRIHEHRKDSVKSEAEYNLALVEALGCKEKSLDITISIDKGARDNISTFLDTNCLSNFVIVHPGSGGSAIDWGWEKFRGVVRNIADTLGLNVVVTGTAPEHYLCRRICEGLANAINAAGRFSMLEFIALISKADLFISNSTGPLHLAAAVGTPLIGIYPNSKPMTPVRWAPLTENKILMTPKDGSNDLSLISVEDVMESIRKFVPMKPK